MAISTNSIIHYTNTFKVISLILKEGFLVKYCEERLKLGNNGFSSAAHPMVSFCDIPLSTSQQHFDAYGRYGIGLSKDWAIKNGVNPVLYIDKNSLFANSLLELIKERRKKNTNLTRKQGLEILQIKSYAKNYSGSLKKNKVDIPNYRFYDEREWRLVPSNTTLDSAPFSVNLTEYREDKKKYNDRISNFRVEFTPKDISYIIVNKTTEIPKMIKFLREELSDKCSAKELDLLFSKICSTEQIIDDY